MRRTLFAFVIVAAVSAASCSDDAPEDENATGSNGDGAGASGADDACDEALTDFNADVWAPVLSQRCLACHNPSGLARDSGFVLLGDSYPGYLAHNHDAFVAMAGVTLADLPAVLAKPSGAVAHSGGEQLEEGSAEYEAVAAFAAHAASGEAPAGCEGEAPSTDLFEGVQLLDWVDTFDKAASLLGSRPPTAGEVESIRSGGEAAFDTALDGLLREEAFYVWAKETWQDVLLTDAFIYPSFERVDKVLLANLDPVLFEPSFASGLSGEALEQAREAANRSMSREPLNIIEHVLREERPFGEVLTASYTIGNGWAARAYGMSTAAFDDPDDPEELRVLEHAQVPSVGVLSTPAYLTRYPTSLTNVNRLRSKTLQDHWLGFAIEALPSPQPSADDIQAADPTYQNVACIGCHANLDPVAGTFQNWTDDAHYRRCGAGEGGRTCGSEGWAGSSWFVGHNGSEMPDERTDDALRWMAEQLVHDPRFGVAVASTALRGLTGDLALDAPRDSTDDGYRAHVRAHGAQRLLLETAAADFRAHDDSFRELLRTLIKSAWFRATVVDDGDLSDEQQMALEPIGAAGLLSPEALSRKMQTRLGVYWGEPGPNLLLDLDAYYYVYGGIDPRFVAIRPTRINQVGVSIVDRMASQVACRAVNRDLYFPAEQRLLLPYVEADTADDEAVRANIQHLHAHLLGERLELDSAELNISVQLFAELEADITADLTAGHIGASLADDCTYSVDPYTGDDIGSARTDPTAAIRVWMSFVAYLIGDHRFLHR